MSDRQFNIQKCVLWSVALVATCGIAAAKPGTQCWNNFDTWSLTPVPTPPNAATVTLKVNLYCVKADTATNPCIWCLVTAVTYFNGIGWVGVAGGSSEESHTLDCNFEATVTVTTKMVGVAQGQYNASAWLYDSDCGDPFKTLVKEDSEDFVILN